MSIELCWLKSDFQSIWRHWERVEVQRHRDKKRKRIEKAQDFRFKFLELTTNRQTPSLPFVFCVYEGRTNGTHQCWQICWQLHFNSITVPQQHSPGPLMPITPPYSQGCWVKCAHTHTWSHTQAHTEQKAHRKADVPELNVELSTSPPPLGCRGFWCLKLAQCHCCVPCIFIITTHRASAHTDNRLVTWET